MTSVIQNILKSIAKTSDISSEKICSNSASKDVVYYDPKEDPTPESSTPASSPTSPSYYEALYNLLYSAPSDNIEFTNTDKDGHIIIGTPKTDIVLGALNLSFEFYSEIRSKSYPNYMKYILTSNDISDTFFNSIKGLIDSSNFIATFDSIGMTTKTNSGVLPIDLSDTSNCYVRNTYGQRNYNQDNGETKENPYTVLGIILNQFNELIDKVIRYNLDGSETSSQSLVVKAFFKAKDEDSTRHLPYKEFMQTLLLPAVIHHFAKNAGEEEKFFYYIGYIPKNSKCSSDMVSEEAWGSTLSPSIYSTSDSYLYSDALSETNQTSTGAWFKLSIDSEDPVYHNDDDAFLLDSSSKATTNIYTFPEDMTIYSYLLNDYASAFITEIKTVIERMQYFPVLMRRFYDIAFPTTDSSCSFYPYESAGEDVGEDVGFDYVEPIVGFPIYRTMLLGEYAINACSESVSGKDGENTIDLNKIMNNVMRNISYDTSDSNLIEKYASAMTNTGGHEAYINLPNIIFDIDSSYGDVIASDEEESVDSSKFKTVYVADTIEGVSKNSLKLTTDSGSSGDLANYAQIEGAYRNTVRVSYMIETHPYSSSYKCIHFIFNSHGCVQHIQASTNRENAYYTVSLDKSERDSQGDAQGGALSNKSLVCSYSIATLSLPSYLKNRTS